MAIFFHLLHVPSKMRNQLRTQMKSESVIGVQTEMYILIVITAITFFSIWSSGIQGQSQGSW